MIPDGEKVAGKYLREHDSIEALSARVVGKTPESTATPWIRLTELDAPSVGRHRSDRLIEFYFQLDCYAGKDGGQPEAKLLMRTARAVLGEMPAATHDGVRVTGVDIRGSRRLPDGDFEPARERVILTALVWMRNDP